MTFSIVAFDPPTNEIGIGVQSKVFAVGSIVPFVKAGVGAVATQSLVNVSLGPIGLELMEEGRSPQLVMDYFKEIDPALNLRQLGMYSVKHGPFSYTGQDCLDYAGSTIGENYACQGNLLSNNQVIEDMATAFESASGPLARKIVTALEAGQAAGGDSRGKQSAAILIHQKGAGRAGYGDTKIDIRVDDHLTPIQEISRLLEIRLMSIAVEHATILATEDKDNAVEYLKGMLMERKAREMDEAWVSLAVLQYRADDIAGAEQSLRTALEINPGMASVLPAYPDLNLGFDVQFVASVLGERVE